MNRRLLACVFVLAAVGNACAADGRTARQAFRQIDRNGDKALQFVEIEAARAAVFDRLDTNRDGVLDRSEAQAAIERAAKRGKLASASLEGLDAPARRMDADGDGRISKAEFVAVVPERLLAADRNGDGALSINELKALRRN